MVVCTHRVHTEACGTLQGMGRGQLSISLLMDCDLSTMGAICLIGYSIQQFRTCHFVTNTQQASRQSVRCVCVCFNYYNINIII